MAKSTSTPATSKHIKVNKKNGTSVKAYQGDHMTLLGMDIDPGLNTPDFVGFTIWFELPGGKKFPILNKINFDGTDKLTDSMDAPIQKFRWLHVPGSVHQTLNNIVYGNYKYYVTPRYYDKAAKKLKPLDASLTASVTIPVGEFKDPLAEFAFTRSYVNSQAYKYRFGANTAIVPKGDWLFDTSGHFTTNNDQSYTYEQLYEYLGFTARKKILDELKKALASSTVTIEMFTYDFNEPEIARICLELAKQGRIRIISDNYISKTTDKKTGKVKESGHGLDDAPETLFFDMFDKARTGRADIVRGKFSRFQHNKQIIFSRNWKDHYQVLSGATNFSITGICVNANHVVLFKDPTVAAKYSEVFNKCWGQKAMNAFKKDKLSAVPFKFKNDNTTLSVTFSPHQPDYAASLLTEIAGVIEKAKKTVLFSVMQMSGSGGDVIPALMKIKENNKVFSYGITDQVGGDEIALYKPGSKRGILVNAQKIKSTLPPPFNKEYNIKAHKIHHKFVVVDFNTPQGRVYFGSSNLALGGEKANGDNLICIKDPRITTVFAIEALRLVDHFHFRASQLDVDDPIVLRTTNVWATPYFDRNDIKYTDRTLFA